MSEVLILEVSCAHEHASDTPELFLVEIDAQLKARIKQLSELVVDLGVRSIRDSYCGGIWSPLFLDGEDLDDPAVKQDMITKIKDKPFHVESVSVNVTETQFYFTAVPRGAGRSFALETDTYDIAELEAAETSGARPIQEVADDWVIQLKEDGRIFAGETKVVSMNLSALARYEYGEDVVVPVELDSNALEHIVSASYDSVDATLFSKDPDFWEKGDCYPEES